MTTDLTEFIPWILAIFFVLFLIACCSWLYRCIQKCDDQCPGFFPTRSPYNPNSPITPFPNIRHTRELEGARRLTTRSTTNDSNEPSGSCILSSNSIVHFHGQKAPPYVSFNNDRPPPPTYEEACSSVAALDASGDAESSAAIIDTENLNETDNTDPGAGTSAGGGGSTPNTLPRDTAAVSISRSTDVIAHHESFAIDNPQDQPLIDDDDDDDDDMTDVVIEPTTSDSRGFSSDDTSRRDSSNLYL